MGKGDLTNLQAVLKSLYSEKNGLLFDMWQFKTQDLTNLQRVVQSSYTEYTDKTVTKVEPEKDVQAWLAA